MNLVYEACLRNPGFRSLFEKTGKLVEKLGEELFENVQEACQGADCLRSLFEQEACSKSLVSKLGGSWEA